jgi:hypothetical protein
MSGNVSRRYPPELRERAVRMVGEIRADHESEWAVDRHRAGELDAFDVDRVLFQYSTAAKELWKFCNYLPVEVAAAMIREQAPHDWWERGAPASGEARRIHGPWPVRNCRRYRGSRAVAAVRICRCPLGSTSRVIVTALWVVAE